MPRKTLVAHRHGRLERHASMRPRPDAAENLRHDPGVVARHDPGFNEAAARCRGKRRECEPRVADRDRFNEAAARCRGKRPQAQGLGRGAAASMRPRPDAAENSGPRAARPRS